MDSNEYFLKKFLDGMIFLVEHVLAVCSKLVGFYLFFMGT